MESAVNFFPPRHERLGVREHTEPASTKPQRSRVPRVGSTGRALLEHRWFIGGMKLACFPLELAKPLLRKLKRERHLRRAFVDPSAYAPYHTLEQTSFAKAIPEIRIRRSERAARVRPWQRKIVAAIEMDPGREFLYSPRRKILRYLLRLQTSKFLKSGTVRAKGNGSRLLSCILHARALRKKQSYNVDCSRNSAEFLRSKLQPGSKLFRPRRLNGGASCTRSCGWSCYSFLRLFFTSFWAARKKVSHVL